MGLAVAACGGGSSPDGGGADVQADTSTTDALATDVPVGDVTSMDVAAADANSTCTAAGDCDDGVFCNGAERCMPGAMGADARGCVPGAAPCPAGQTCNEGTRACTSASCATPDMDGDGHASMACGGDDCDDTDPHRFPGNTEVCAVMMVAGDGGVTVTRVDPGHDEDCDPTTYANGATRDGDFDGDGFVDSACCNTDRSGGRHCGDDCADLGNVMAMAPFTASVPPGAIHPMQAEACNGVDDNCNMRIDDGLPNDSYYPDCDGDGYGDASNPGSAGCGSEEFPTCNGHSRVRNNTDCNDTRADVHPGAMELCTSAGAMRVDENCNGMIDEGCGSCAPGTTQPCGVSGAGCTPGTQTCLSTGFWSACPATGTLIPCFTDSDGDGFAPMGAATSMACVCPTGTTARAPSAGAIDCNDANPSASPGATEVPGDGIDETCDGQEICYIDGDGDGYRASGTATVSTTDILCHAALGHALATTAGGDCCDTDNRAHPGQTTWFSTADACGSYDYDCNTTQEQEWTTQASGMCICTGATCGGMVIAGWPLHMVPACGARATWFDHCGLDVGSSSCLTTTCRGQGSMRTQLCH